MTLVVIIGAGVAGIAAAIALIENGFKQVIVLEASGRVGGRIHSMALQDSEEHVELGAQWYRIIK